MPKKRPFKPARPPKPKRRSSKGSARRVSPPAARKRKSSPLLDTRVIFCGDNLQKLADFPDALTEIDAFFRRSGKAIIALTVKEILEEEIAKKLA